MRVFISCDMEGVAGIVDWQQVTAGPEFAVGRRLMLEEVNAAIDGAVEGGATSVVVSDAHGEKQNFAPEELHGEAEYCSGRLKPLTMMEGLDSSFDAIFFVGYHGAAGGPASVLSHTYNPAAVQRVTLNDTLVGESGVNALVALHYGVPIALISGDQHAIEQAKAITPDAEMIVVKHSLSRLAAVNMHPAPARRLIRAGALRALERLPQIRLPRVNPPYSLHVHLRNADLADLATHIRGVERTGTLDVTIEGQDPLMIHRSFLAMVTITRGLAQEV
ncbi:MAG: M55 family metallopeptidase [Candidatus Dormiibacterota bacterium]